MGERWRIGFESTARPPPGEKLSLVGGECPAGIFDGLSKRTDVDWWEGGLTSPGVRDLRGWRLVRSDALIDSGHPSKKVHPSFAAGHQVHEGYHRPLRGCEAAVTAAAP